MNINEINRNSWNRQAERYQENADFSFDVVDYGDVRSPNDDDLKLIGDVENKKVLEIGCGGANCGIALAKKGALVTCTDISAGQLEFAKRNAEKEKVNISFAETRMEDLSFLKDKEFDKVVSICAIMYVKDIDKVFKEVHRVLKPGGSFIFSTNDPVFYSIAAALICQEENIDDSYFYAGEEKWKWESSDDFEFVTYRRPICEYINLLIDSGFRIERFHELPLRHINPSDPEQELENKYPRIMVFKVAKDK